MSNLNSVSLGEMKDGQYHLRGESLTAWIGERDFTSALWFAWTGVWPEEKIRVLLEACLVACLDHGEAPPSAQTTRLVASCGKPVADAVAAGLLTFGARHGNAGSAAAHWLQAKRTSGSSVADIVTDVFAKRERVPGFGHMEYAVDPRAMKLAELAKRQLATAPHVMFALEVAEELTRQKGKPLPLNIDGALGAIMSDLQAPAELADALFLVARSVGLIAQARCEAAGSLAYKRK